MKASSYMKNEELVKILIDSGADPNKSFGHEGDTPLILACRYSTEGVVKLLIDNGASVYKKISAETLH